jgi:hypothetical protein
VTKVITVPKNSVITSVKIMQELTAAGGQVQVQYRLSGFGSISGEWITIDDDQSLSIPVDTEIQFKIGFKTHSADHTTHTQIQDLLVGYQAAEELSDNWEYSFDDSSSGTPTRCGFRLKQAYGVAVPSTLRFYAHDLSGTLIVSDSITSQPTRFNYSADGGTTWQSLGTIPNVVGTLVRYTFTSPPGTDIRPSLKDS